MGLFWLVDVSCGVEFLESVGDFCVGCAGLVDDLVVVGVVVYL